MVYLVDLEGKLLVNLSLCFWINDTEKVAISYLI